MYKLDCQITLITKIAVQTNNGQFGMHAGALSLHIREGLRYKYLLGLACQLSIFVLLVSTHCSGEYRLLIPQLAAATNQEVFRLDQVLQYTRAHYT